jgi:hypothetical protein
MNSRLIPWCLAATAFVATLTVSGWQGNPGDRDQLAPPHTATGHPSTPSSTDQQGWHSSQALAVAPTALENVPRMLNLPLPSAAPPELDSNIQSVPDDEPTVDDLPGRRDPSVLPAGE